MNYNLTVTQLKEGIRDKLSHTFGVSLQNATNEEYYKAVALIVRELMAKGRAEFNHNAERTGTKQIYYLCMEFLLGRSLRNNLCNLGLEDNMRAALSEYGIKLENLYEQEPDAGLGNGGLGRLAACFLDGLATQGYPAMGYSLPCMASSAKSWWTAGRPSCRTSGCPGVRCGCSRCPITPWRSILTGTLRSAGTTSTTP